MFYQTRGFSLLVALVVVGILGAVGYFALTKQPNVPKDTSNFVTFNGVEEQVQLEGFYRIRGTTNAQTVCMVIDQGTSVPKWNESAAHAWSGCLGHSLAKDENGVWDWYAPVYENGTLKLESGQHTIVLYGEEHPTENSVPLGSHSFEVP